MKLSTKLAIFAAGCAFAALLLFAPILPAATDSDTSIYGRFIVQGTAYTEPTCATASGAGDGCFAGDLETNGALDVAGASTLTGAVTATASLTSPVVASTLTQIRFCGNGSATGIADYMGPVLLDDTEADLAFGGAGCDGLNNATEATADAPWHAGFAFTPVAMACVGMCTGATTANDAITYQLRDDTANVTGVACTAAAWTADAQAKQCSVRIATAATVAANSAIAIKTIGTDDACADAGDDFECILTVVIQ